MAEGTLELSVRLPVEPGAVAVARHTLDGLGEILGPGGLQRLQLLQLLVSELVTNSIRHGGLAPGDWIDMYVRTSDDRVRVEVVDPGAGFRPDVHIPAAEQTTGWGLYLVDRLADRWGVAPGEATRVWFEIDRHHVKSSA